MSQFVYFIETQGGVTQDKIEAAGLGYAFESMPITRDCLGGPEGGKGVLLSFSQDGLGYYPDRQMWARGDGDYWVGWSKEDAITEQSLRRSRVFPGQQVEMANSELWTVPVARRFECIDGLPVAKNQLPQTLQFVDGEWVAGEVEHYAKRLWDQSEQAWQHFVDSTTDEGKSARVTIDLAVDVLAINYRIGRVEVGALGLFDSSLEQVASVAKIVCDLDGFFAIVAEKKTKHDVSSQPGQEEG